MSTSKKPVSNNSILLKTIKNESFIEKFVLLILTVFLSGLLIPYITTQIQRTKARNDIVLQAQNKLLDDVTQTLLTYETLLLDISWYKTPNGYNEEMHKKSFERYSERSVDLLSEWRIESIKAKNLASIEISKKLDSFQLKMFDLQDSKMNKLYRENSSDSVWNELHNTNLQMLAEVNQLIPQLASEMKITKEDIK